MDQTAQELNNNEILLKQVSPDMFRIYKAIKAIQGFGGCGSVEVHLVHGKIKLQQGIFIKPGFSDELIAKT